MWGHKDEQEEERKRVLLLLRGEGPCTQRNVPDPHILTHTHTALGALGALGGFARPSAGQRSRRDGAREGTRSLLQSLLSLPSLPLYTWLLGSRKETEGATLWMVVVKERRRTSEEVWM